MNWKFILNERGCFGGGKPPAAPPPPSPAPVPLPEQASPAAGNEAQQKQLQMMRNGLASTIKTSPQGVPSLNPMYQTGKSKLGQ